MRFAFLKHFKFWNARSHVHFNLYFLIIECTFVLLLFLFLVVKLYVETNLLWWDLTFNFIDIERFR